MPEIRQLSPSVVNKIAAGEVIERPASVVKELMENAVDAGSTRIDVAIAQGGLDLVRVADNGCGMRDDQLRLAVASHATSKIQDADDLFRVGTLGFRGEALASIAEISNLTIRSRTADSPGGAELEITGGRLGEIQPVGAPVGTAIEVRNLFFNTPVRRKFMRTTQTEMGHAGEAFTRIALAYPQVHFTLRHNDKTLYDLPPCDDWRERIGVFFGGDLASTLIPIAGRDEAIRLSGYAADPQFSRSNNRLQYFFLNGRHIRDRALQHALGEAYRGLLLTGRFPIAFLRLEMPADAVDVNVHPTKLEVRFQDSGRVYTQLLGSLRKKFLTTDLTARVHESPGNQANEANDVAGVQDRERAEQHRRELVQWAKGEIAAGSEAAIPVREFEPERYRNAAQADLELRYDRGEGSMLQLHRITAPGMIPASGEQSLSRSAAAEPAEVRRFDESATFSASVNSSVPAPHTRRGMQIQHRYIVTETAEGMMVIDQHALHERILYEQIREKTLAGALEAQKLLVPEAVHLTAQEASAALDAKETLAQLGIEVEPFGGDTILVQSYPALLANLPPAEILRTAIERLTSGGKLERRDLLDELLHMISCKAAIKAGDYLSSEEITSLLEQRECFADTHHCPHGRPTALVFSRDELDRRFKRT